MTEPEARRALPFPVNDAQGSPALLASLFITLVGGVMWVLYAYTTVRDVIGLIGAVLFVVGTVSAVVLTFRQARRLGTTWVRALGNTLKFGGKWLLLMLP